jgi:hypothetical protein
MQTKDQWKKAKNWKVVTAVGALGALGVSGLALAGPGSSSRARGDHPRRRPAGDLGDHRHHGFGPDDRPGCTQPGGRLGGQPRFGFVAPLGTVFPESAQCGFAQPGLAAESQSVDSPSPDSPPSPESVDSPSPDSPPSPESVDSPSPIRRPAECRQPGFRILGR